MKHSIVLAAMLLTASVLSTAHPQLRLEHTGLPPVIGTVKQAGGKTRAPTGRSSPHRLNSHRRFCPVHKGVSCGEFEKTVFNHRFRLFIFFRSGSKFYRHPQLSQVAP